MNNHKSMLVLQPSAEMTNPHIWTDSRSTLNIRLSIYETLVGFDQQVGYIPGLAESWWIEPDARTWTFRIRQEVTFHDGSVMTVEDVKASLEHACSPHIPGSYGTEALLHSYLGDLQVEIIDRSTIRLVTPEPMADLLDLLVLTVIMPAKTLTQTGVSATVGCGPFRLEAVSQGLVSVSPFNQYWKPRQSPDHVTFQAVHSPEERVAAFCRGEADMITYIPPVHQDRIEQAFPGSYRSLKISLCVILIFNFSSPKLQDVRVRQALNIAVNVDELIQSVLGGHAARLSGPLSPQHSGSNPDVKPYPYNPGEARRLLSEAGYPGGIDLAFEVPTRSPDESLELAGHLIRQYQQAGIRLHQKIHTDRPAYAYMVKDKKFEDVCIFDSSPGSSYRVLREKINSKIGGPWWAGYSNPRVDALMEQAWGTVDMAERTRLYRSVSALVHADAPWVFLYNPLDGMAVQPESQSQHIGYEGMML